MSVTIDPTLYARLQKPSKDAKDFFSDEINLEQNMNVQQIEKMYSLLKDNKDIHFHELFKSCDVLLPEPKFSERNPELEARIQRLKAEQENREYKKMTNNLNDIGGLKKEMDNDSFAKQVKELNNYLILIVQFIVSVVTSFFCGYLAPYFFYGITDMGSRLLVGIILAFVVAVADLYFMMRYFLQTEGVLDLDKMSKKYQ